jgi:hypothetical protein
MRVVTVTLVMRLDDDNHPDYWLPEDIEDRMRDGEEILDYSIKIEQVD